MTRLRFFKKYPINVIIFRNYGNAIGIDKDRGRYIRSTGATEAGTYKEMSYIELQKSGQRIYGEEYAELYKIGRTTLFVFEISKDVYTPLKFGSGLIYYDTTVNVETVVKEGEEEKKVITPVEAKGIIFDSKRQWGENGSIEEVPTLMAERVQAVIEDYLNSVEAVKKVSAVESLLEKYMPLINTIAGGFIFLLALFIIIRYFVAPMITEIGGLAQALDSVAASSASITKMQATEVVRNGTTGAVTPPF